MWECFRPHMSGTQHSRQVLQNADGQPQLVCFLHARSDDRTHPQQFDAAMVSGYLEIHEAPFLLSLCLSGASGSPTGVNTTSNSKSLRQPHCIASPTSGSKSHKGMQTTSVRGQVNPACDLRNWDLGQRVELFGPRMQWKPDCNCPTQYHKLLRPALIVDPECGSIMILPPEKPRRRAPASGSE